MLLLPAQARLGGGGLAAVTLALGATAALTVLMAWAGATGRLAPNPFLGIRTSRTRASERAWYHVHRAAAPWCVVASVVLAAGTVAPLFLGNGMAQAAVFLGASALYLLVLCAGVVRAGRTVPPEDPGE
ncbi:SdpI family protein [Haloactinospora alba]|uniref:SdpI family protein n=1 Tax=Haloactinospora alba TaxID=405555 RepID=UPI001FE555D5|nr:SdpI family protein [Haloactinospora alba]